MNSHPSRKLHWLKPLLYAAAFLVAVELMLRWAAGFGTVPVYHPSLQYEYALSANQDMVRFGKRFHINEEGMRSAPLGEGEWRILKFGDSVLNGGVATAQEELASSLLEERLSRAFTELNPRVLNVSAGSWGPDNAYAWMEAYGHFDARAIVLVFSSHDWQDQMTFQDVVGRVPYYPSRQPAMALTDALGWLWSRYFQKVDWASLPQMDGATPRAHPYNTGWDSFALFASQHNLPLVVYHHPTRSEWAGQRWNADGESLEDLLRSLGVISVSGLTAGYAPSSWRDDIHPNADGQRAIAAALEPVLLQLIMENHGR